MEDGVLGPEGSGERPEASGRGLQGRCSLGAGEPGASARGRGAVRWRGHRAPRRALLWAPCTLRKVHSFQAPAWVVQGPQTCSCSEAQVPPTSPEESSRVLPIPSIPPTAQRLTEQCLIPWEEGLHPTQLGPSWGLFRSTCSKDTDLWLLPV